MLWEYQAFLSWARDWNATPWDTSTPAAIEATAQLGRAFERLQHVTRSPEEAMALIDQATTLGKVGLSLEKGLDAVLRNRLREWNRPRPA
jgi:hypothetical protein